MSEYDESIRHEKWRETKMRRISIVLTALCAALLIPHLALTQTKKGLPQEQLPAVAPITLTTLAANVSPANQLDNLIAVDYQETSDSLVVSVHYKNGLPNNFVRVSRTGVITPFSSASGYPEEVYLAVAPSQNCSGTGLSLGGFKVGDVFAGSGTGTIARISADGTTVQNPFATLPGETGQDWGGLYFDRSGNFGGDLMVSTTSGGVYRVNSSGVATLVARLAGNGAIEGIISLPNDSRFGPLSGKILVGGTDIGLPMTGANNVLAVDPIDAMHPMGTFTFYNLPAVVEPEGFRIVPVNGDFFGTDFLKKSVVTAPGAQFSGIVGDLVIAAEGLIDSMTPTSKLFDVVWDPVNNNLKATEIIGGSVFQYEGITFACAAPTVCVPSTLTCPANVCATSGSGGPSSVSFATPATSGGTFPGQPAVCAPPSGSIFAIGTTPVTCTAADGCGTGGTASCGFNVTLSLNGLTIVDVAGSGSSLTINVTTGAYVFTCGDGFTMSGIALLNIKGGIITLQDNNGGRCVQAKIDLASGRSVATLEAPMGFVRCQVYGRGLTPPCGP
ncbi:MAG: hypothetical protein DMF60_01585 [Acidobacteria bacterium]|nr:MAG: hypothetical protein DMF60_01585 [Acidobacteriota bacterium]